MSRRSTTSATDPLALPRPQILLNALFSTLADLPGLASTGHSTNIASADSAVASDRTSSPVLLASALPTGQVSPWGSADNATSASASASARLLSAATANTGISNTASNITHKRQSLPRPSQPPARSLFLTLHALFPHVLLPALDTLDRGLVIRLVPVQASSTSEFVRSQGNGLYYVRSTKVSRKWGRPQQDRDETPIFEVRLGAWNCSCAAFTFSALSRLDMGEEAGNCSESEEGNEREGEIGTEHRRSDEAENSNSNDQRDPCQSSNTKATGSTLWRKRRKEDDTIHEPESNRAPRAKKGMDGKDNCDDTNDGKGSSEAKQKKEARHNQFGGLRLDKAESAVPVCKHLLACLLVERCPPLAGCVEERTLTHEEQVGWTAGWV